MKAASIFILSPKGNFVAKIIKNELGGGGGEK
jgi:hypothetical protein